MKKIVTLLSAALLAVGMSITTLAADIHVSVDGASVAWTDAKPFIDENSRTLVPLRPIANALGLEVTWNDDTNTASFTDGETTAEFTVGSSEYHCFLNDFDMHVYVAMDTTPVIKDSRIYAPARYLAECFQYTVGWDQATQTVSITKAEAPEEETIRLPEVPAGQLATASPVTAEAGSSGLTYIVFDGVTLVDDPDIFEYSIDIDTTINGLGAGYSFADGFVEMDLMPELTQAPGTYPVTFTIDKGFFTDAEEDVVVSTTLTITAPKAKTVLEKVLDNLDYGLWVSPDCQPEDVVNAIAEETDWFVEDTPFKLTVSDGSFIYDAEGSLDIFCCTLTVTNTETGESTSLTDAEISLYLTSE